MRDVFLNWQAGTSFGWGLAGLNLFGQWANDPSVRPLMGFPIEAAHVAGLDPLRIARITAAARASNEYLKQLGEPDPSRRMDAVQIDGLGNDFTPATTRRAKVMAGRVVFETSAVDLAKERLARYDLLLTVSRWNSTVLEAATGRTARLIHEGVDESLFCPGPRSGWLDPNRFYVYSGGKVEFRKAQDLVIIAFRRFAERHRDAVLVTSWHSPWLHFSQGFRGHLAAPLVVGANGTLDIRRWAVENGIASEQLIDIGLVPNVLLPGVLREMDVALQPSRAEGGTNLPVKEAMACGVPVIAALNTGLLDLLSDENSIPLRRQTPVAFADVTGTDGWGESDVDEIDAALEYAYQDRAGARARVPLAPSSDRAP